VPTGDTRERTLIDPTEFAATDLPAGILNGPVRDAIQGTASALGPELVRAAGEVGTPLPKFPEAMVVTTLLEAAERAEGHVHSLANAADGGPYESRIWAMAAAWLRSRAAELAAGLGPEYLERTSEALMKIAEGWMHEARDLYDAGRTVDRYMAAVEGTRGALGTLAAALGSRQAGLDGEVVGRLAGVARGLANAARFRDDLLDLTPSDNPGRPAGQSLAQGVYSLPVILSLERDPGLAGALGGAIAPAELPPLVERIWLAAGPLEASARCRSLTENALSALTEIEATETLADLGARIIDDCDSAVAR
jgi:heptaprenyl diphosphate synthase